MENIESGNKGLRAGASMSKLPTSRKLLSEVLQQLAAVSVTLPEIDELPNRDHEAAGGDDADDQSDSEYSDSSDSDFFEEEPIFKGADILNQLEPQPRQLLLALHCLLPSTLLPALDLLDQRLVTRYQASPEPEKPEQPNKSDEPSAVSRQHPRPAAAEFDELDHLISLEAELFASEPHPQIPPEFDPDLLSNSEHPDPDFPPEIPSERCTTPPPSEVPTVYYVQSSIVPRADIDTKLSGPSTLHEVRPKAWNCTCAKFTFDSVMHKTVISDDGDVGGSGNGGVWGGWMMGGEVPMPCKHLLACVLLEHCPGIFGGFVEDWKSPVGLLADMAGVWG